MHMRMAAYLMTDTRDLIYIVRPYCDSKGAPCIKGNALGEAALGNRSPGRWPCLTARGRMAQKTASLRGMNNVERRG